MGGAENLSGGLSGWQRHPGDHVYAAEIFCDRSVVLWVRDYLIFQSNFETIDIR